VFYAGRENRQKLDFAKPKINEIRGRVSFAAGDVASNAQQ
jgi:hypothetical protein